MRKLSLSALRQNLFRVADEVLRSGEPVEIERNGKTLLLAPAARGSKLVRLKRRKLIEGKPETIVEETAYQWHESEN